MSNLIWNPDKKYTNQELYEIFIQLKNKYFRIGWNEKGEYHNLTGRIKSIRKRSIIFLISDEYPKAIGFRQIIDWNECSLYQNRVSVLERQRIRQVNEHANRKQI